MRLALLMGNRFSAWHLQPFLGLPGVELRGFRADSEIQQIFLERDDGTLAAIPVEQIRFRSESRNPLVRLIARWGEPTLEPFAERLEGYNLLLSWELFTDWTWQALEAKRRFGTPVAITVWDNIPFNQEDTARKRAIKEYAIEDGDLFIVPTERSRETLEIEGVLPSRIQVIPPSVDLERFSPGAGDRASLGLPADDFVIAFVGWMLPRKGLHVLLHALRRLLDDPEVANHRLRLVVVGSGPGRQEIEQRLDRLALRDRVIFTGAVTYDQMPNLFRCADAFVLPSLAMPTWQEQFGMALIEAMACGRPCIAAGSGAIPEILGDAGLLVQADDFVSMRRALKQLLLEPDLGRQLGSAARARAEAHFALHQHTDALAGVLRRLAR